MSNAGDGPVRKAGHVVRVLVVDDQELARWGVRAILDTAADMEVVGEAVDGNDAVEKCARLLPDVVLMDVRMPNRSGIDALADILAIEPAPRVLMLTTLATEDTVLAALEHGALGFLRKDLAPDTLLASVRTAAAGGVVLSTAAASQLLGRARHGGQGMTALAKQRVDLLSPREVEVLALVGAGLTNGEIAARLFMSTSSVKNDLSHALEKLGLSNRTQAAILAHDAGLRPKEAAD